MSSPEYWLFLPQMRMTLHDMVERAVAAEAAGFDGIALMDHMVPPLADDKPMYEAMTAATWLAARTTTLRVSHLVLCDSFRSPTVLARQCVTLDHASGGRFELGIGSGSVVSEFAAFGFPNPGGKGRSKRLAETVEVLRLLWAGGPVDFDGEFHQLRNAQQQPTPLGRIPITVGGAGPTAISIASTHGDWLNLMTGNADRVELREPALPARLSLQQIVAFVHDESSREETKTMAIRRFGGMGRVAVGDAGELRAHFDEVHARGIDRFYVWFTDFAPPATLAAFGEGIISRARQ